jgi:hypothetical protein
MLNAATKHAQSQNDGIDQFGLVRAQLEFLEEGAA